MPPLASWLRRALGGKRKINKIFHLATKLRRNMSAFNRGMTHFYRGKSREAGKNPAGGGLSQDFAAQRSSRPREPWSKKVAPVALPVENLQGESERPILLCDSSSLKGMTDFLRKDSRGYHFGNY
jgi:hypothetical protein